MSNPTRRELKLKKRTLRILTTTDLDRVQGGIAATVDDPMCMTNLVCQTHDGDCGSVQGSLCAGDGGGDGGGYADNGGYGDGGFGDGGFGDGGGDSVG